MTTKAEGRHAAVPATAAGTAAPGPLDGEKRPVSWKFQAASRYSQLHLDTVDLYERGAVEHDRTFEEEVVWPLDAARRHIMARHGRFPSLRQWWTGAEIEDTWRLLHQASEGLVLAMAIGEVRSRAPDVLERARDVLGSNDDRVKALGGMVQRLGSPPPDGPPDHELRHAVLTVLRGRHMATDSLHQLARTYRNTILLASLTLFGLALLLLVGQDVWDFQLFRAPAGEDLGATAMLALVLFFGCAGALFSAAPSVATQPTSSSPYAVAKQQVLFKVAIGAWSAVIGLMAITTGLMEPPAGTSPFTSLQGVIMLSALFGAGQEAVSRFADRKVQDVLVP